MQIIIVYGDIEERQRKDRLIDLIFSRNIARRSEVDTIFLPIRKKEIKIKRLFADWSK